MLKFACAFLVAGTLSTVVLAQDNPKFEVFGGYSMEHIQPCPAQNGLGCGTSATPNRPYETYNGWNASATIYFLKYIGATADLAGRYGQGWFGHTSRYSYLFGPTFSVHIQQGTPFAHVLFGRLDDTVDNYNRFAWAAGGGFDLNVAKRIAVRLFEIDYEHVNTPGFVPEQTFGANGFRYSGGIVFKF